MKRLLITGGAGHLASEMRSRIAHVAETLRLADIVPVADLAPNEEAVVCDLTDGAAICEAAKDCDGILHLGGRSLEATWPEIRAANFDGTFHVYEAARKNGIRRVVFASSNHVTGFYPPFERLDAKTPHRPDCLYGLGKAFGEDLSRLYWDKFGVESVCIRIGSCFSKPTSRRMLSTWLSFDDLGRLVERCFITPEVGWTLVYGVSANDQSWWDNSHAAHLGWEPKDNAEAYRAEVEAAETDFDPEAPENRWQGGAFATWDIIED